MAGPGRRRTSLIRTTGPGGRPGRPRGQRRARAPPPPLGRPGRRPRCPGPARLPLGRAFATPGGPSSGPTAGGRREREPTATGPGLGGPAGHVAAGAASLSRRPGGNASALSLALPRTRGPSAAGAGSAAAAARLPPATAPPARGARTRRALQDGARALPAAPAPAHAPPAAPPAASGSRLTPEVASRARAGGARTFVISCGRERERGAVEPPVSAGGGGGAAAGGGAGRPRAFVRPARGGLREAGAGAAVTAGGGPGAGRVPGRGGSTCGRGARARGPAGAGAFCGRSSLPRRPLPAGARGRGPGPTPLPRAGARGPGRSPRFLPGPAQPRLRALRKCGAAASRSQHPGARGRARGVGRALSGGNCQRGDPESGAAAPARSPLAPGAQRPFVDPVTGQVRAAGLGEGVGYLPGATGGLGSAGP